MKHIRRLIRTLWYLLLVTILFPSFAESQSRPAAHEMLGLEEYPELLTPGPTSLLRSPSLGGRANYRVRVVYLIPSNRSPQPEAEKTLQEYIETLQGWFRDQMERLGYGPKTFFFETAEDGVTPKVNIAYADETDREFHSPDYLTRWNQILSATATAGFPPWRDGEVLFIIPETHVMQPDGSFIGAFVGGAGTSVSGVAAITADFLARMKLNSLIDDRPYAGLVIPELGPYQLVSGVSFALFEGTTVSSVSSSAHGAAAHELGHAFSLWHDFRNDENFHGVLMGNGLRGFRGYLFPNRYPTDDTRLDAAAALLLNYSRFFNPFNSSIDTQGPDVGVLFSSAPVVGGQCGPAFTANDNMGLAGAILIRSGSVVGERELSGMTSPPNPFRTPYYEAGHQSQWEIMILDQQGNRTLHGFTLTCPTGANHAPMPDVSVSPSTVNFGQSIALNNGQASDPDGSGAMLAEWDINDDGVFDTVRSTTISQPITYESPGVYRALARITDDAGDSSLSAPIGIRVLPLGHTPIGADLVTFAPIPSTFETVFATAGCPAGFAGSFRFTAQLFVQPTSPALTALRLQVRELTNGNLLQNADGIPGGVGAKLTVAPAGKFSDRTLSNGEYVNVPLMVCLRDMTRFEFLVDVVGDTLMRLPASN